jgi:hypothetical protein
VARRDRLKIRNWGLVALRVRDHDIRVIHWRWPHEAPPLIAGLSVFGALGCLIAAWLGWRLLRAIKKSGDINSGESTRPQPFRHSAHCIIRPRPICLKNVLCFMP